MLQAIIVVRDIFTLYKFILTRHNSPVQFHKVLVQVIQLKNKHWHSAQVRWSWTVHEQSWIVHECSWTKNYERSWTFINVFINGSWTFLNNKWDIHESSRTYSVYELTLCSWPWVVHKRSWTQIFHEPGIVYERPWTQKIHEPDS